MLSLRGGPALTPFRRGKLEAEIRRAAPSVTGLHAEHWYFVDLERQPSAEDRRRLELLLPLRGDALEPAGTPLLVVPRLGTLSPWASKATDIAHSCGLPGARRIERGTLYRLAGLTETERPLVLPVLHDRMTETVLDGPEHARE